uniref:J domain-containing protein n=1 Tax=Anopheles maculatus TaxID=74869 RepID=A0A182ST56_9DIPT
MSAANHYAVLGVSEDAPLAELIAAYRALAPKCHPNSTDYVPESFPVTHLTQQQYWQALGEAMEVLMEHPADPNGNRWYIHSPPTVQQFVLVVTLEDIFAGTTKTLTYYRMRQIEGRSHSMKETLDVPINQYMRHGMWITIRGAGHETELGNSDVMVQLCQTPHPIFTVSGNDLICRKAVPLSIALFGGYVKVQTIDLKTISIFVPPNEVSHQFLFEGEGLPAPEGRGTMQVNIQITIPKVPAHLQDDARRIIREIESYDWERALEEQ